MITVFKILTFQMFDLENLGQSQRMQQWCDYDLVANVDLTSILRQLPSFSDYRLRILTLKIYDNVTEYNMRNDQRL